MVDFYFFIRGFRAMLSALQAKEYESGKKHEVKSKKQQPKPDVLEGWVLTSQQRSFIESFFEEPLQAPERLG